MKAAYKILITLYGILLKFSLNTNADAALIITAMTSICMARIYTAIKKPSIAFIT